MNHLRAGWRLAASSRSSAPVTHFWVPEDPNEAHRLIVGLTGRGHSARHAAMQRWGAEATNYDHARLADVAAGGFSHHPSHGAGPDHGWMASYDAPEGSGIGQVHNHSEITPEHIAEHRSRIHAHLQEPDTYQGGWLNEGKVYLDVSRHFEHEEPAKDFAVQQKQKAIFHLGDYTERFIDPHQDPLREENHSEWQQRYHGRTDPHPGWHSYGPTLYPDTHEQAAARPNQMSKGAMRGRVVHPGQSWNYW